MSDIDDSYLVVSLLGEGHCVSMQRITASIHEAQCFVVESKFSRLGSVLSGYLLVSGRWDQIAKLENFLEKLAKQFEMDLRLRRSMKNTISASNVVYSVYLLALDKVGILERVTDFFIKQAVDIIDLSSHQYLSRYTGNPMASISLQITVPVDINLADVRDRFMLFCDDLNLDGCDGIRKILDSAPNRRLD